jgi:hypothetical protein
MRGDGYYLTSIDKVSNANVKSLEVYVTGLAAALAVPAAS